MKELIPYFIVGGAGIVLLLVLMVVIFIISVRGVEKKPEGFTKKQRIKKKD